MTMMAKNLLKSICSHMKKVFLSYLKEEIAKDLDLATEEITLMFEPFDIQLKE